MSDRTEVTALLLAWSAGDDIARSRLIDAVYDELRRLARGHLRRERENHSLAPTALVHEAYLKALRSASHEVAESCPVLAIAARIMRRILVDHARSRGAAKRVAPATVLLDDVSVAAAAVDVVRARRSRSRRD
jgi:RNA polymerase sigma factor (TIGR02999 family)